MSEQEKRSYNNAANQNILIFSCSGGADVGYLSDLAARKMMADGHGKMFCLAGIGGNVEPILKATRNADKILVIDGCPVDCAKKTLEKQGFLGFQQIRITDIGFEKGKTEINDESVATAAAHGVKMI